MITVAIAAVLASIAWPAYQNMVQRSRRADAISALAVVTQAQERWRGNNPAYTAALADLGTNLSLSPGAHYDIAIVDGSVSGAGYTATATVHSGSAQSGDSKCQVFRVVWANGNFAYTSTNSGNSTNAEPDPCWVR